MEALRNSYLKTLAENFVGSDSDPLSTLFIFPSLRSVSEFKHALIEVGERSTILPDCLTISQLISRISAHKFAGSFESSAALKKAVRTILPNIDEDFVQHVSSQVLSDLSELEMFEFKPEKVFKNAAEIYNIDRWGAEEDENEFHGKYESLCRSMLDIKLGFEAILAERGKLPAYKRYEIDESQLETLSDVKDLWLCGFAVLSPKEQSFFRALSDKHRIRFSWKVHDWYIEEENNQAGRFFRDLPEFFQNKEDLISFNDPPISYGGFSSNAEAQLMVINQLQNDLRSDPVDYRYGIILGDESQLLSLLHFVEKLGDEVNVSASLSAEYSPLIKDLLSRSREKFISSEEVQIRFSWVVNYVDSWNRESISSSIMGLLDQQKLNLSKDLSQLKDDEFLLNEIFGTWSQFRSWVSQLQMNIKGSRESRVQVFGLLESRTLDFDRLYFLNWNEGNFQGKMKFDSLIPFTTRNEFGLPMNEEKESVFSYYFFSLLSSAKSAVVSYIDSRSFGSGEQSRLLQQIIYEKQFKRISEIKQNQKVEPLKESLISKDEHFEEEFDRFLKSGISPSAINQFIWDPFDFYYRYLWRIDELPKVDIHEDSSLMGNVVHKCLEKLYEPYLGKIVGTSELEKIRFKWQKEHSEIILSTREAENLGVPPYLMRHLAEAIDLYLREDVKRTSENGSFELLYLEKRIDHDILLDEYTPVKLKGTIDRIEKAGNTVRIIDYKTGKLNAGSLRLNEQSLAELWTSEKHDKIRQLLFYYYLVSKLEVFNDESVVDLNIDGLLYGTPKRYTLVVQEDVNLPKPIEIEEMIIKWVSELRSEVKVFSARA